MFTIFLSLKSLWIRHSDNLHPCSCIKISNNKICIKIQCLSEHIKKNRKGRRIISKNDNVVYVDGKLTSKTTVTTKISNIINSNQKKFRVKLCSFCKVSVFNFSRSNTILPSIMLLLSLALFLQKAEEEG